MIHLSERARNTAPSPTLAITAKAKALQAAGRDLILFGAGEPDFDTPAHIKRAAAESLASGFTKYTASAGIEPLMAEATARVQDWEATLRRGGRLKGPRPATVEQLLKLLVDRRVERVDEGTPAPGTRTASAPTRA